MLKKKFLIMLLILVVTLCFGLIGCDKDTVTITFDSNGGSETMSSSIVSLNDTQTLPSNTFTKDGYSFVGWALDAEGDAIYADGAEFTADEKGDITLYAIWEETTSETVTPILETQTRYVVNYYFQSVNGTDYNIDSTKTVNCVEYKDTYVNVLPLSIDNFVYREDLSTINGLVADDSSSVYSIYYDRDYDIEDILFIAEQNDEEQNFDLRWTKGDEELIYDVTVNHGDSEVSSQTVSAIDNYIPNMYAYYGKQTIDIKICDKADETKFVDYTIDLNVTASEYNIAPLNATFPVTLLSLSYWNINTTPTFIFLERADAYNWDNLPENVYALPTVSQEEIETPDFHSLKNNMIEWVKELHEIDEDSTFNLYCTDNYCEFILQFLTGNGIDTDHSTVNLLSDGSGSYSCFAKYLGTEEGNTIYTEMAAKWAELKDQAASGVSSDEYLDYTTNEISYSSESVCSVLEYYAFVIACEEDNVNWWLARSSLLVAAENNFNDLATDVLATYNENVDSGNILTVSLSSMLTALTDEQQAEFKLLYNFGDEMFEEAETTGKKVMMFLGTRTCYEYNFEDYVTFMKSYYDYYYPGEYVYYYKGHPGTPTELDADKTALLETLGLTDVNSSIAAELIIFFNPEIELCGYTSSTYQNIESQKANVVFGLAKGETVGYTADFYVTTTDDTGIYKVENAVDDSYILWDVSNPTDFGVVYASEPE
jgi:uncharacterized repeat protein (TIGR02543 family)